MRINLLGQVTIHADGADTDLLAPLQPMHRLFVAILALAAGQPVGMDRLETQLWDGYPPADPRGRLYTCANRIRAALRSEDAAEESVLMTAGGGYCLRVAKETVDVHRFRAKATEARARFGPAEELAVALARDALREWGGEITQLYGGEPLVHLAGEWAAHYRYRLQREYRDILIELIAAELRRGGADRVIAEFAGLADADEAGREDEQLAALLMRAYYACGRQSEALKTYLRTAESLRKKEVEAGRELRMLEKKIRNQDPSLEYQREPLVVSGELAPVANEDAADPGGDTSDTDPSVEESPVRETRAVHRSNSRPTYSQQNFGRTVVANQGTQHVNLGGSDE